MKKYAHLIARVGANIKKGQPVRIIAEADQFEFINLLVTECYKLGASRVDIEWTYQLICSSVQEYRLWIVGHIQHGDRSPRRRVIIHQIVRLGIVRFNLRISLQRLSHEHETRHSSTRNNSDGIDISLRSHHEHRFVGIECLRSPYASDIRRVLQELRIRRWS